MKPYNKYFPLLIGIAIAIGIFIGGKLNFTDSSDRLFTSNSKKDKLNRLIDYIDYEYVDDVNTDSIVDVTVNSILDNLDPHSTYIPSENLEQIAENMKGDFVGIGVSFYTYKDTVTIIRPLEGGPSIKAGLKGGDRIVEANGEEIFGEQWSNELVVDKLKGDFLLIHGSADDNVHLQNTMEMISALVNANKQFNLFIYPDKNHGIYGGNTRYHLYKKMTDFILDNL